MKIAKKLLTACTLLTSLSLVGIGASQAPSTAAELAIYNSQMDNQRFSEETVVVRDDFYQDCRWARQMVSFEELAPHLPYAFPQCKRAASLLSQEMQKRDFSFGEIANHTYELIYQICASSGGYNRLSERSKWYVDRLKLEADKYRKKYLLEYYPRDLTKLHKIGIDFQKADGANIELQPEAHYISDGEEYFVFFNDQLTTLYNILRTNLKNEIGDEKGLSSSFVKRANMRANGKSEKCIKDEKFKEGLIWQIPIFGWGKMLATAGPDIFGDHDKQQRALNLSALARLIKEDIEKYGTKITPQNIGVIVISKNDATGAGTHCYSFDNVMIKNCREIERVCQDIVTSDKSVAERLNELGRHLDMAEKTLNPFLHEENRLMFCFAINRINHYFEGFEHHREIEDLDVLEAMTALKIKIRRLAIKYKFMLLRNESPILGLKPSYCKVLENNKDFVVIYIEWGKVPEFKGLVKEKLDATAQGILKQYPDRKFSKETIRKTAAEVDPDSYDDFLNKLNLRKIDLKAQRKEKWTNAGCGIAKVIFDQGAKIIEVVTDLPATCVSGAANTVKKTFSADDVEKYMAEEEKIKSYQEDPNAGYTDLDEAEYYENHPFDSFPQRNTNSSQASSRRSNNTSLGKELSKLMLTGEDIDKLAESFKHIVEANKISKLIALEKDNIAYWGKVKGNVEDFINLVKLRGQLSRAKLKRYTTGCDGILVEEDRTGVTTTSNGTRGGHFKKYRVEKILEIDSPMTDIPGLGLIPGPQ